MIAALLSLALSAAKALAIWTAAAFPVGLIVGAYLRQLSAQDSDSRSDTRGAGLADADELFPHNEGFNA